MLSQAITVINSIAPNALITETERQQIIDKKKVNVTFI